MAAKWCLPQLTSKHHQTVIKHYEDHQQAEALVENHRDVLNNKLNKNTATKSITPISKKAYKAENVLE